MENTNPFERMAESLQQIAKRKLGINLTSATSKVFLEAFLDENSRTFFGRVEVNDEWAARSAMGVPAMEMARDQLARSVAAEAALGVHTIEVSRDSMRGITTFEGSIIVLGGAR